MRRSAILLAASLTVGACTPPEGHADLGGVSTTTTTTMISPTTTGVTTTTSAASTTTPPAPLAFAIPFCGAVPNPTAPDDWYRDEPQYVGNEMPIWEVRQFASSRPGFQVVWIDRDHNGWVSVGFHGTDLEARQAELEAEFSGVGVVAVAMPHSQAELEEARRRVDEALPEDMYAANVREVAGVVEVWVGDLTADRVDLVIDAVGDDPVCIEGWDPGSWPPEGPQPEGGDGWRYLGEVDFSGFLPSPRLAADAASWTILWQELGEGSEPPVDFDVEIAVAAEIGHSSSCPETRLDDVVAQGKLVYPEVVHTTRSRICTADYVPRTYFFTVARDRLPDPPFQVAANPNRSQRTRVDADLSTPGSVPGPSDVTEVSVTLRRATTYPHIVETSFPGEFTLELSCGVEWLGEVNGYFWRTDTDVLPPEWVQAAHDGLVELDLLLEEGSPPLLTLSGYGASLEYRIDEGPAPGC